MMNLFYFESMRTILASGAFPHDLYVNLLIGASLAMIFLLGMYQCFVVIYRHNLKTGAIARFNAEAL